MLHKLQSLVTCSKNDDAAAGTRLDCHRPCFKCKFNQNGSILVHVWQACVSWNCALTELKFLAISLVVYAVLRGEGDEGQFLWLLTAYVSAGIKISC